MLVDHHLHIENRNGESDDNFQDPLLYINQGTKRGVEAFGFSDHAYIFNEAKNINFNSWQEERRKYDLSEYGEIVKKLSKTRDNIQLGLEIDYVPEKEEAIAQFIEEIKRIYQFDFLIGSVHWLGEWGFDLDSKEYKKEMNSGKKNRIFEKYFQIVEGLISSGLFHIVGHIDLIKIFGERPSSHSFIEPLVSLLKKHDQVIEINTNGKNKPIREFYPGWEFIEECFRQKIFLTLGSDAHSPDRTGENFDEMVSMLKKIGYQEICYFKGGKKVITALP